MRKSKVRDLAWIALGAALLAVGAWISIPLTVPVTMQTMAVFTTAALLGRRRGTLAVLVYLLLGAVGVPVFSGFRGGIGSLLGVTGGYLVGFLPAAWIAGLCAERGGWQTAAGMVAGLLVCYACGTLWFWVVYTRGGESITVWAILLKCVIPFLIPDAVKIALSMAVVLPVRAALQLPNAA